MKIVFAFIMVSLIAMNSLQAKTKCFYKKLVNAPLKSKNIVCKEVSYSYIISGNVNRERKEHELEVYCGTDLHSLQIKWDDKKLLAYGKNYKVLRNTEDELIAATYLTALPSISYLMIDKKHGTLLNTKMVGKGVIGSKVVTSISRCKDL
jgi:hypothetical protein